MIHTNRLPHDYTRILSAVESEWILSRIWSHDHTVWDPSPSEIDNRLGWLHAPESMRCQLDRLQLLIDQVQADRVEHVLLLGMGGSSLAPETFMKTYGSADGFPSLTVLDSTHPDAVLHVTESIDLDRTLVIVATKSGTTTETLSLFRYIYRRMLDDGIQAPGDRFLAITDPGSPLVQLAKEHAFRGAFLNDPNIGGRYAALSFFGLLPAALLGIDTGRLIEEARTLAIRCAKYKDLASNPSVCLGVLLGAWAREGRDKATFVISERIAAFGDWVEQLIAESTGKQGTGILPVVGEPLGAPKAYGADRLFIHLRLDGDAEHDAVLSLLEKAGHPVVRLAIDEPYALGAQFFLWELAIALVGHVLGINPFDQPNVESAKRLSRETVAEFLRTGSMPKEDIPQLTAEAWTEFLRPTEAGDYVAVQAYTAPSPEMDANLSKLRALIRKRYAVATTVGYGPRFLHSTGQLHKGGKRNGRFIQLISPARAGLPIPDRADRPESSLTFETLIRAQAYGDRRALESAGQQVAAFVVDDQLRGILDG